MWLKTRRTTPKLEALATVIAGSASHGQLTGSYEGHAVEARPRRANPVEPTGKPIQGAEPRGIDTFWVTLHGVAGHSVWHSQSSPSSLLQQAVSQFTTGPLLRRFAPGEFKFGDADPVREAHERMGGKVVTLLGVPIAATPDKAVQERLIAAGLFEELAGLRWGPHPYMPKAAFFPPVHELAQDYLRPPAFARVEPRANERPAGNEPSGFRIAAREHMKEADPLAPGRLVVEVEAGKERVPSPERFGELLGRMARISQINADATTPTKPKMTRMGPWSTQVNGRRRCRGFHRELSVAFDPLHLNAFFGCPPPAFSTESTAVILQPRLAR